ncbi:MAG: hypothetical protein ACT4RN_15675 [Pseudonocardia sp.]
MDARLNRLLDLLDSVDDELVGTSVRLPVALRDAAGVAIELGLVSSTTALATRGLRAALEIVARRAVLDAHYEEHPEARPDLGEIAQMSAELNGHPIAGRPELVRRAAAEIVEIVADPRPDEVLAYAAGLAAAA